MKIPRGMHKTKRPMPLFRHYAQSNLTLKVGKYFSKISFHGRTVDLNTQNKNSTIQLICTEKRGGLVRKNVLLIRLQQLMHYIYNGLIFFLNTYVWFIPFSFLVTLGDEVTKIQKYYVIFVYILQDKMGKTEKETKRKSRPECHR